MSEEKFWDEVEETFASEDWLDYISDNFLENPIATQKKTRLAAAPAINKVMLFTFVNDVCQQVNELLPSEDIALLERANTPHWDLLQDKQLRLQSFPRGAIEILYRHPSDEKLQQQCLSLMEQAAEEDSLCTYLQQKLTELRDEFSGEQITSAIVELMWQNPDIATASVGKYGLDYIARTSLQSYIEHSATINSQGMCDFTYEGHDIVIFYHQRGEQ
ncbi:hypothetical protein [Candidatus Uabimicrobium amorphum]|uniref:Uncharacterized protein n=1 Tax=Uabimicrobium amorphum TaxID=2596890 RepID=A0A5S9IRN5_UABAM|nr:hypothetical protein [Candidatus Uabimicrobium amorphum]BBM86201.1 hypothetical protein UABAM_04587 [Candidatus Uabimicrobium amorphum]